jgi:hypothetical protein
VEKKRKYSGIIFTPLTGDLKVTYLWKIYALVIANKLARMEADK